MSALKRLSPALPASQLSTVVSDMVKLIMLLFGKVTVARILLIFACVSNALAFMQIQPPGGTDVALTVVPNTVGPVVSFARRKESEYASKVLTVVSAVSAPSP